MVCRSQIEFRLFIKNLEKQVKRINLFEKLKDITGYTLDYNSEKKNNKNYFSAYMVNFCTSSVTFINKPEEGNPLRRKSSKKK